MVCSEKQVCSELFCGMGFVNLLLNPIAMKRLFLTFSVLFLVILAFSRCSISLAFAGVSSDQCERCSIYRSTLFGEEDLLWEETACDYGTRDLEARCNEKMEYYSEMYSYSTVYKEHVTYNQ